jgi:VanZ family protein
MPLMEPKHFLMPFLAHAIGTFVAAYLATRFSKTKAIRIPIIIAALFFIGGLIDVLELHAPIWFSCTDLALAYFPTAFLAYKWAKRD